MGYGIGRYIYIMENWISGLEVADDEDMQGSLKQIKHCMAEFSRHAETTSYYAQGGPADQEMMGNIGHLNTLFNLLLRKRTS